MVAAKGLSGDGLYNRTLRLPATIEVFLVLTGILVMWHHLAPMKATAESTTAPLLSGEGETA